MSDHRQLLSNLLSAHHLRADAERLARPELWALRQQVDEAAPPRRLLLLRRAVARFNMAADPGEWLADCNGKLPLGRLTGLAVPYDATTTGSAAGLTVEAEVIPPGAFRAGLADGEEVWAEAGHGGPVFALRTCGELALRESPGGLLFRVMLPDSPAGQAALELVESGCGVSVAFCNQEYLLSVAPARVAHLMVATLTAVALEPRPAYRGTIDALFLERNEAMLLETTFSSEALESRKAGGGPDGEAAQMELQYRSELLREGRREIARRHSGPNGARNRLADAASIDKMFAEQRREESRRLFGPTYYERHKSAADSEVGRLRVKLEKALAEC